KRAGNKGTVLETVPREGLWRAQTPQMFRYIMLRRALESFPQATDESGAIEAAGLHPRLVEADNTNFKLTWPQDLYLAEQVLQSRIDED
ncbi:MAG: 2-C-methyl-D-erythritol 4-phosphate cytidylyltransferase, partial [Rhodocyclaceae bacterium]|nr:2-C-methyl-D-erythritol 4-phosphate cytidylyltransferase [Rhodocyclaceae bacterium]